MKVQTIPARIPGPRPIPFLGAYGSLVRFFRDPIRLMRSLHERYGEVAAVSGGDASLVCAFGPVLNQQVLSNPNLFHNVAEFPIPIPEGSALQRLTTALVGMNGEKHRSLRRAMMSLLQKSQLERYREGIVAATNTTLSRWRPGEELDLSRAMAELALSVAFRCLFGLDVTPDVRPLAQMAEGFTTRATALSLILFPYAVPRTPYSSFLRHCEQMEVRLLELIAERRAQPENRRDVLSALMSVKGEDGVELPDSLLVGLTNELFIAGHETTAQTLAWTLFLLERHPHVLGDLLDELTVLNGDAPTMEQIQQLPLLDAVIKESMRLLPAIPFLFFRRNAESVRLGDYALPAGASVVISPLITHHMPELYAAAKCFRPERWGGKHPSTYEYLPFAAGPRTCLGMPFATVSLRVMLPLILQRFRLSLAPGADVSYQTHGTVLGTKCGIPMRIERRDRYLGAPRAVRGNIHELVELVS